MIAKQASIKDIARLARVSHSTVSRALRGSPLVNAATAAAIRRIARRTGYLPSAVARSLVTRRTRTIGVVVTNIADPFVAGVVSGIEDVAHEAGFSVFLANAHADPEREVDVVRGFEERRVDGIIVTSSRVGALHVPRLARRQAPIVLLNNQHPSRFAHSVMIDNVQAAREATRHLAQLGHRRIAYLGDRYGYQSDAERFTGYSQALKDAGLPWRRELVVYGDGRAEGAGEAIETLMALPEPPTAVFCYNDMTALGALRRLRVLGIPVPAGVSIVGFDDLFLSEYLEPPLTTVRQPMRLMGRMAMETLIQLMTAGKAAAVHDRKVGGELVVRQSTAPPGSPGQGGRPARAGAGKERFSGRIHD